MSSVDSNGMLVDIRIISRRFPSIEKGSLSSASAIVVHQTDTTTGQQALNSYFNGPNGAHFLIDESGQIYQTASTRSRCYHIGALIKSKCLTLDKSTCDSAAMAKIKAMQWRAQVEAIDKHERAESYPDRYPINSDSLGIEIVGQHIDKTHFQAVTPQQNASLQWLISELYGHFNLTGKDVSAILKCLTRTLTKLAPRHGNRARVWHGRSVNPIDWMRRHLREQDGSREHL